MSRAQQLKSGDVSLGLAHEWVCAFGRHGGTAAMLQETIEDASRMQDIIDAMKGKAVSSESMKTAAPAYSVRMVSDLLFNAYSVDIMQDFGTPPVALPGFLTFFDPGWNILRLREFCADKGKIFFSQDRYDDESFARMMEKPRYRQIRLEAVDGSFNKNFDDQRRLLPDTEDVPLARVVAMGMVIHFLLSGQRLFEHHRVRCADQYSVGYRVSVGHFDSGGFVVDDDWDGYCDAHLGLASSRKS